MRIALNKFQDVGDISGADASSSRAQASTPAKTGLADDTAQLSPDQVRVQSLAGQVNELPEVRQEKVTQLGLAIQQGNYNVTPQQISEAMIENMRSAA